MKDKNDLFGQCMTVGELMEYLESFGPDTPVVFKADYGDRMNTMQALPLETVKELGVECVTETGYSRSGWKVDEADDDDEDNNCDWDDVVVLG